ncbi:hypothetical protein Tco_0923917 [Tanacetum coccineum]|uniref:Uncharacterized protein n=1 Tax=Tanacetum coccineum TaxID=301880 RepID=A0ABQ5D4M4_9ASTR
MKESRLDVLIIDVFCVMEFDGGVKGGGGDEGIDVVVLLVLSADVYDELKLLFGGESGGSVLIDSVLFEVFEVSVVGGFWPKKMQGMALALNLSDVCWCAKAWHPMTLRVNVTDPVMGDSKLLLPLDMINTPLSTTHKYLWLIRTEAMTLYFLALT